jgi:hypothetical protein
VDPLESLKKKLDSCSDPQEAKKLKKKIKKKKAKIRKSSLATEAALYQSKCRFGGGAVSVTSSPFITSNFYLQQIKAEVASAPGPL